VAPTNLMSGGEDHIVCSQGEKYCRRRCSGRRELRRAEYCWPPLARPVGLLGDVQGRIHVESKVMISVPDHRDSSTLPSPLFPTFSMPFRYGTVLSW